MSQTLEIKKPELFEESIADVTFESKVILYNDDWHTFEEVISQLMKAVGCTFEQGRDFAFEVHFNGKAVVFNGALNKCLAVSSILEEIALHTQVVT